MVRVDRFKINTQNCHDFITILHNLFSNRQPQVTRNSRNLSQVSVNASAVSKGTRFPRFIHVPVILQDNRTKLLIPAMATDRLRPEFIPPPTRLRNAIGNPRFIGRTPRFSFLIFLPPLFPSPLFRAPTFFP